MTPSHHSHLMDDARHGANVAMVDAIAAPRDEVGAKYLRGGFAERVIDLDSARREKEKTA